MMRHDPQEMVRYFGDFLTEINTIIVNIKQCVYELVDVYLPLNDHYHIQNSMRKSNKLKHKGMAIIYACHDL